MKKFVLVSVLGAAAVASAQTGLRTSHSTTMDSLRDARKQMEVQTENTILEKIEAQRLEDERRRYKEFESLNFSVVNDGTQTSQSPAPASF
nr:hypothetical protein CKG001_18550 [Bdellovibrio sp. CKG001]BFD63112.1 hypothetical protein BdHM001_17930 [Bdellovibrio sp. HM001]